MVLIGPALPPDWEKKDQPDKEIVLEQQPCALAAAEMALLQKPELPQLQMQPPKPDWVGLGLGNMGNSCYLNSVLQCLTYCPPLGHLCLGSHHSATSRSHEWRTCAYCLLEKRIKRTLEQREDIAITRPKLIYDNLCIFSKSLRQGRQEDAHEFLRVLLEAVEASCIRHSRQEHLKSGKEAYTMIQHIFGGRLQSQVSCLACGRSSITYDTFCDLSLEIAGCAHVENALNTFTATEDLKGANAYQCEHCKRLVSAQKCITIQEAPNVLVIHLKRFASAFGSKIGRHVGFSELLSLNRYLSSDSPDHPTASSSGHRQDSPPANYRLRGVVVHQGSSANSGHYYAYVDVGNSTSPSVWWEMNDAQKRRVGSQTVLGDIAYLLLYVREEAKPPRKRVLESADDRSGAKRARTCGIRHESSPGPDTPDLAAEPAHDNNSTRHSSIVDAGSFRPGLREDGAGSPARKISNLASGGTHMVGQVHYLHDSVEADTLISDTQHSDATKWKASDSDCCPKGRQPLKAVSGRVDMPAPNAARSNSRVGSTGGLAEPSGQSRGSFMPEVPMWMAKGPDRLLPAQKHLPMTYGKQQLEAGRIQIKSHAASFGPKSVHTAEWGPSQSLLSQPVQSQPILRRPASQLGSALPADRGQASSRGAKQDSSTVSGSNAAGGLPPRNLGKGPVNAGTTARCSADARGSGATLPASAQGAASEDQLQRVKSSVHSDLRHSLWPKWLRSNLEQHHAIEPGENAETFREEVLSKLRPLIPDRIKASAMEHLRSVCKLPGC